MIPKGFIQNRRHRKIDTFDFPSHLATISHAFLTFPTSLHYPYYKAPFQKCIFCEKTIKVLEVLSAAGLYDLFLETRR